MGSGFFFVRGWENTDAQTAPVDFGITTQGTPVRRSFTVQNTGSADLPLDGITRSGGNTYFRLEFLRRTSGSILYTPQKSASLSSWLPVATPPVVTPVAPGWERVVIEEPVEGGNGSKMFLRVQVSQP